MAFLKSSRHEEQSNKKRKVSTLADADALVEDGLDESYGFM